MRLILTLPCLAMALGLAGCLSGKPAEELSVEAACLQHNEHDPVERDRCRLPPATRSGTVPDMRPQDLPVRTAGPGD